MKPVVVARQYSLIFYIFKVFQLITVCVTATSIRKNDNTAQINFNVMSTFLTIHYIEVNVVFRIYVSHSNAAHALVPFKALPVISYHLVTKV